MIQSASSNANGNEVPEEPGAIAVEEEGEVRGTVRLSLPVLSEMVELTVQDTPGVAGVLGKSKVAAFFPHTGTDDANESARVKEREHGGIKVRVRGNSLDADVIVLAASDVNIPELGRSIQSNISTAAERMLGMTVGAINVHVAGIESTANELTH